MSMEMDLENRLVATEYLPEDDGDNPLRPRTLREYVGQEKVNPSASQWTQCIWCLVAFFTRSQRVCTGQDLVVLASLYTNYVVSCAGRRSSAK